METNHELFIEIEKRRLLKIKEFVDNINKERALKLKKCEMKFRSTDNFLDKTLKTNIVQNKILNQHLINNPNIKNLEGVNNIQTIVDISKNEIKGEQPQQNYQEISKIKNEMKIRKSNFKKEVEHEKIKSNEILKTEEKIKIENKEPEKINLTEIKTNIPIANEYIKRCFSEKYYEILKKLEDENKNLKKFEKIKIKQLITKRLSQVTTDKVHLDAIISNLKKIKNDDSNFLIFEKCLVLETLEQGRIQVSVHSDSYKSYSYLLSHLLDDTLYLKAKLITKSVSDDTIKRIYSIYFGYLLYKNNSKDAWEFLAAILNIKPQKSSLIVLEIFLKILGNFLYETVDKFSSVVGYILNKFLPISDYEPGMVRIKEICQKFI
ncbi:hypothetical protein DMUE_4972 [Dictyocoela muelleri]|nr:hypothetical protein DMUE_4972 [Dictyocoela muelleri]